MDGQVYVTVEADEATPMVMSAAGSGGGQTTLTMTIRWTFAGGISGDVPGSAVSWEKAGIVPVPGDVAATNNAVSAVLKEYGAYTLLMTFKDCVSF